MDKMIFMDPEEKLKKEIFSKVIEYYNLVHAKTKEPTFIEGTTRINYGGRVFNEKELIACVDSALEFWLTYGNYSRSFEKKFAEFLGVRWAFLVNSGSSANLLAFFALTSPLLKEKQIKRGDEVITIASCFPTTITPILQYGAIPVFCDIELTTYNIDVSQISKALSQKTKAVVLAHTLGNPFNLNEILLFCKKNNLWLIEDNCDALGSKYNNKYTGTFGDIGTSSFYPPHHMTMGEGGAVYTSNPLLKKILLSMRDWGRDCYCESGIDNTCNARFAQQFGSLPYGYDHKYVYSHFGFNLKISDMQAAIGIAQLEKLPVFVKKRKENFSILYEGLKDLNDYFIFPILTDNGEPSWFGFMITLKESVPFQRNEIVEYLETNNIQTRNLFAGNILRHPMFDHMINDIDYRIIGELKNTDKVMKDSFWIGVYPGMCKDALQYIIKMMHKFVEKYD